MLENRTGSDRPSTLGGSGWRARSGDHGQELAAGRFWARCGTRSEIAPLEAVMLAWPPDSFAWIADPNESLMNAPVDVARLRRQASAIHVAYRSHGVEVHSIAAPPHAPPNLIFMRDLFFMTAEGAVVGRAASEQRAGEERWAAEGLARAGIPILRTIVRGTFEGADALWLDPRTVMIGVGFRTDPIGARAVADVLRDQGVDTVQVELGRRVQHLLGAVVLIDRDLAAVRSDAAGPGLRRALESFGYRLLICDPDAELIERRGMNFVTLGPRRILMPAGSPQLKQRFERAGVRVEEIDVSEYVNAAGGLGCVTGIVRRQCDGRSAT